MNIKYNQFWFRDNADLFDLWFDPETFDWFYRGHLIDHCIAYVDIWYDPSIFKISYDELLLMSIK